MFCNIKKHLVLCLILQQSVLLFSQNHRSDSSGETLPHSISQTWDMAVQSRKKIDLSSLEADVSAEEIRESKYERFPEISLNGKYEYATNIHVNEDGMLKIGRAH